uniref:Uncharacterized protein n=1 Tax=Tanacetum cinerariifolium TaxID=118510 RepID=A0A6L2KDD1_TANCI|nr:hypothetical protein [Tanacetum cinerariifolium]
MQAEMGSLISPTDNVGMIDDTLPFHISINMKVFFPLEMPCSSTFKTTISFRNFPIVPLSIHNISVARTSAVMGKVPYFVTLVALLAVSGMSGAETRVHTPTPGESEAQNRLPNSILSSEPKPLVQHRPHPP